MFAANRKIYTLPVLIFVIGLMGSILVLVWLVGLQREKISRDFGRVAGDRSAVVAHRLLENFSVSQNVRQLFDSSDFVSEAEFDIFVSPMLRQSPELKAIAWVTQDKIDGADAPFTISYLQGQEETGLKLGSNLNQLPGFAGAVREARELGKSRWINLPGDKKSGSLNSDWLVVQSVKSHSSSESGEENAANSPEGILVVQVDLHRLMEDAFSTLERIGLDAEIFDDAPGGKKLLARWLSLSRTGPYDPIKEVGALRYASQRTVKIDDREWTIYCRPAPLFLSRYQWWEQGFIFVGGVLMSALLAVYILKRRLAEQELRRQNEIIGLLENVAMAANEMETTEQLLAQSLQLICRYLSWPFGHVYVMDDQAPGRLISSGIFEIEEGAQMDALRDASLATAFDVAEGLPGYVTHSAGPVFVPNVHEYRDFRRGPGAKTSGVYAYCAFPVMVRKKVAAVVEFFHTEITEPAHGWTELLASMASQISHAMERYLAADELLEKTTMLENAAEGIARIDLAGNYLSANKAYAGMCGLQVGDLIGANDLETIHPADRTLCEMAHRKMTASGRGETKARRRRVDGSYFFQELVFLPDLDKNAVVRGSYLFMRDISERENQQRALRESEERFMAFMANSPASASIKDEHSRLVYINPACSRQFGLDLTVVLGKTPEQILRADIAKIERANDEAMLASGEPLNTIELIPNGEGEMRHWMVYKFPMKGEAGKRLIGVLCLDITERMEAEKAIAAARDEAVESARLKSQFLANMSHEIRTPMNGLIGMLGLLGRTPLEGSQQDLLQTALSASDSLLRLLNDILDFSKIEAGKLEIDPVAFDPRQCLRHAVKMLQSTAHKKDLSLTYSVADNVPTYLLGDTGRLTQILVNLINNGIKFTAKGSVTVSLEVEHQTGDGEVLLLGVVRDTGIGVSESHRSIIFQPFRQSDSSTARQYGGTGLGLAICAQLAGLMGGEIWVESEPSGGSAFHFTVEMRVARQPSLVALDSQPTQPKAAQSLRILLAEDNEINQKLAITLLEERGHHVSLARDGHEAVQLFQKSRFDLILMDVQMPGKDGYETTLDIRKLPAGRDIPIFAVTAHAMPEDRRRCIDVGMNDYLTKPIRVDEFARLVEARVQSPREQLPSTSPVDPLNKLNSGSPFIPVSSVRTRRIDWHPQTVRIQIPETPRHHFPKSFDLAALRQLVNNNDQLISQLATSFASQGIEDRDLMRTALSGRDRAQMERSAHRLRGSARSLSASALAEITQSVEAAAKMGNFDDVDALWPQFETRFAALVADLSELNDKRD